MQAAYLVGRLIVGLYYLWGGIGHFLALSAVSGYAAARGVPFPRVAVIVAGLLLVFAGISLLLGWRPRLAVAALVIFLVPVTFIMHAFWKAADPMARAADMVHFTKNLALLGSALVFLVIPEPWPYSVGARARARVREEPLPA